jgi:methylenetetrahydrofolate dehydrogenase (NADP+)/methenyltetrahydrofolate cyclohydrolase
MSGKRLSGKKISATMREEMKREAAALRQEHGVIPGLAVVLAGDDPASVSYVESKRQACADVGLHSVERRLDADVSTETVLQVVAELNADQDIHGILVQLPLPAQNEQQVLGAVHPDKDVDGLHPVNLGRLMREERGFLPCTPFGVQQMLVRADVKVEGKHVVVVGRSTLVGRPVANILLQKKPGANATVTMCHTGTVDLSSFTRQADVLIVAAGRPNTITADMVKDGVVVIDVGVNKVDAPDRDRGWRLVGDVAYDEVRVKAAAITPVPGGVGPMTITMLLHNTILAAKWAGGLA